MNPKRRVRWENSRKKLRTPKSNWLFLVPLSALVFLCGLGVYSRWHTSLPPALGIPEQKLDPTFIASVFTGVLATFGVQTAKKGGDKNGGGGGGGISKSDMERLIEKASATAPAQTIRIEQAPVQLTQAPPKSDDTYKM